MWSSASIEGPPRILIVNGTDPSQGPEHALAERLCASLQRSGLTVESTASESFDSFSFHCLLLFGNIEKLSAILDSLRHHQDLSPFLLAVCSFTEFDSKWSEEVLKAPWPSVPFVLAPLSPISDREAGLFYLKFFVELKLHSPERLTGRMVWFSFSKAKELLRRRRYSAKFGIRC